MDFFIVGTSRTGSTLLRNMLAEHERVAVLNESHWLPRLWADFGPRPTALDALARAVRGTRWDTGRRVIEVNLELADRTWESLVVGLRTRLGAQATVTALHDAVADELFGGGGRADVRGDKTPDYGFYMQLLQRLWPRSRFVHVVRNGIDTALSMARHSGCQLMISAGYDNWVPLSSGGAHERHTRTPLPLSSFVASWRRRMVTIRAQAEKLVPGSYLEVRYEDLLRQPADVLLRVADHLDLQPDVAWVERGAALVRTRPRRNVDAGALAGLSGPDLEMLHEVGGIEPGDLHVGRAPVPDARAELIGNARSVVLSGLERLDDRPIEPAGDEILLFCCARNEATRLPSFFDHYRRLGVGRFLFVDNDSVDATRPFLLGQPDTHVFHAAGSYAASNYGVDWLNALLQRWGEKHWVVVVDADELLVYPGCETEPLPALARRLDARGHDALACFLLDMYADGPIRAARLAMGDSMLETCPYFDADGYDPVRRGPHAGVPARGGARRRLFWPPGSAHRGRPPYLPKFPLVRWSTGRAYRASTHEIAGVRPAPISGALLHFKLVADFAERCDVEIERGEHWGGAAQYSAYAAGMQAQPDLSAMYQGSTRWRDSRQLVELGLLRE